MCIPPHSLVFLFGEQKEVADDFASTGEGELADLGGFDHVSYLDYHHEGVFNLLTTICGGSTMCQALFQALKIELGEQWMKVPALVGLTL